ncbi:MAG: hypothetical protein ACYC2H_08520 [Thermoplasmatota archaeon]
MHDVVGYLGIPVVVAGLFTGSPALVGAGLLFLYKWHAVTR